jgi:predicted FMN-binding regulatory protein PaiB
MYIPAHFKFSDIEEVVRFIRGNAFGMLVSQADSSPHNY